MAHSPKSWNFNGCRYWALRTDTAEIVASVPAGYTPHNPPMHAKFEVYSVKQGLAQFLGYLEGDQRARAHSCFSQAFSKGVC